MPYRSVSIDKVNLVKTVIFSNIGQMSKVKTSCGLFILRNATEAMILSSSVTLISELRSINLVK